MSAPSYNTKGGGPAAPPQTAAMRPSLQLIGDGIEGAGQLRAEGRHRRNSSDPAMSPYSMAVAPDWSFRKRVKIDMGMFSGLIIPACVRDNLQRNPPSDRKSSRKIAYNSPQQSRCKPGAFSDVFA